MVKEAHLYLSIPIFLLPLLHFIQPSTHRQQGPQLSPHTDNRVLSLLHTDNRVWNLTILKHLLQQNLILHVLIMVVCVSFYWLKNVLIESRTSVADDDAAQASQNWCLKLLMYPSLVDNGLHIFQILWSAIHEATTLYTLDIWISSLFTF